jgi:tRNA (Thr-GGU) A37 N-methylase
MNQGRTRRTQKKNSIGLRPIGVIRCPLQRRKAPKHGSEGAPDAWLEVRALAMESFDGLMVDDEIIILTWLHRVRRDALKTGSLSGATPISIDDREHRAAQVSSW